MSKVSARKDRNKNKAVVAPTSAETLARVTPSSPVAKASCEVERVVIKAEVPVVDLDSETVSQSKHAVEAAGARQNHD